MNNNPVRYNDPSGHFINLVVGGLVGAAIGFVAMAMKDISMPAGQKLTAQDYATGVLVGVAAGALIGSGLGVGVGTALGATLLGAGTGATASAAAYTITSGEDYNSGEMTINAGIGAASGAISGGVGNVASTSTFLTKVGATSIQMGVSILAAGTQQIASDAFDGNWTNGPDLAAAYTGGAMAQVSAAIVDGIVPGGGQIMGPLVRTTLIETGTNLWIGQTTKLNNKPNWRENRNSCLIDLQ